MMFRRVLFERIAGALGVALVAAAVLTGCVREEEAEDTVQEQALTPTPWNDEAAAATQSPSISGPTAAPGETPTPASPTVPPPTPFVTPTATPAPTSTPQPGVCPTPKRTTLADFAEPPPLRPSSEIPGQRLEGGKPYSEAYVTVHLPPGREFVIASAWSQDESNLVISLYDAESGSSLGIRGDGCEMSRFVREAQADAVFDEMMKTLEIGPTYVCPPPVRRGPEEAGEGIPESKMTGQRVEGGAPLDVAGATLHLPAGREFIVSLGIADPGGGFFSLYDVQSRSTVGIRLGDGCELMRAVRDLALDATFDQVVRDFQGAVR